MTEIAGKVAVVTGGGSGIGHALAVALGRAGAAVAVADIILSNAQTVAAEITAAGGSALAVSCDVSDRDSVQRLKEAANAALGPVSLVFANAGVTSFEALTEMSLSDIDWIIQVNLMGVTNCLTTFLPEMYSARDGHVVATASMAGVLPSWIPYHAPYSAAKAGIIGMMLNLHAEAAEHGVGSTVLCPGGVESGMKDNNSRYRPQRFGGPGDGPVKIPEKFFAHAALKFRPAAEVAQLVLRAVKDNRRMVVTDPTNRQIFQDTYVKIVNEAFDDAEAFERSLR